jgi:hypothetical protein
MRYQFTFYNYLTNDSGHAFRCPQRLIEIRSAKTKARALEAAKRRFARHERIPDWRVHASVIETEELLDAMPI